MNESADFLVLWDLEARDLGLCISICDELSKRGYSAICGKLRDEKSLVELHRPNVVVINKPHFFYWHRLYRKIRNSKYAVLDTEGVLPGLNRQHCLLEPDLYLFWFSHQMERYRFKFGRSAVIGYPRWSGQVVSSKGGADVVTVATNFAALGYSNDVLAKRKADRQLKLVNDWDLEEYAKFQTVCLKLLKSYLHSNKDFLFYIKFHPNDPPNIRSLLNLKELNNVREISSNLEIGALLTMKPKFHLCLYGCTSILDAALRSIPVRTLGFFGPFEESVLHAHPLVQNLGKSEILVGRLPEKSDCRLDAFIEEAHIDSLSVVADELERLRGQRGIGFRLFDLPTVRHLRYWFMAFIKSLVGVYSKNSYVRDKQKGNKESGRC